MQDKNPFSGLTEEHLSRLEDVLSSEEVRDFLQQTNLSDLYTGLAGARLPNSGQMSDQSLKLDLFDSQASDSSLQIDQVLAHHFIQVCAFDVFYDLYLCFENVINSFSGINTVHGYQRKEKVWVFHFINFDNPFYHYPGLFLGIFLMSPPCLESQGCQ